MSVHSIASLRRLSSVAAQEIIEKVEEKTEEIPFWEETLQQVICFQKMSTSSAKQMESTIDDQSQVIPLEPTCVHMAKLGLV